MLLCTFIYVNPGAHKCRRFSKVDLRRDLWDCREYVNSSPRMPDCLPDCLPKQWCQSGPRCPSPIPSPTPVVRSFTWWALCCLMCSYFVFSWLLRWNIFLPFFVKCLLKIFAQISSGLFVGFFFLSVLSWFLSCISQGPVTEKPKPDKVFLNRGDSI